MNTKELIDALRNEDERKVPIGRSFRWAMLESPPPFIAMVGDQISIF